MLNFTESKHQSVVELFGKKPHVASFSMIAPSATVIGDVMLGDHSSVWYGAVVRGDASRVAIGPYTNVQDRAVISTSTPTEDSDGETNIGHFVTIGHGAILHSCTVENNALIGIQAVIGAGARVGAHSQIAANSYVEPNTQIPSGQLWAGNPAVYKRDLTPTEQESTKSQALNYASLSKEHVSAF